MFAFDRPDCKFVAVNQSIFRQFEFDLMWCIDTHHIKGHFADMCKYEQVLFFIAKMCKVWTWDVVDNAHATPPVCVLLQRRIFAMYTTDTIYIYYLRRRYTWKGIKTGIFIYKEYKLLINPRKILTQMFKMFRWLQNVWFILTPLSINSKKT